MYIIIYCILYICILRKHYSFDMTHYELKVSNNKNNNSSNSNNNNDNSMNNNNNNNNKIKGQQYRYKTS
jgi:hypothetical protein